LEQKIPTLFYYKLALIDCLDYMVQPNKR